MTLAQIAVLREVVSQLPADHDASGEHRPTVREIFTPAQHANALDPNTPIVVGARGAGKSFWAGVLGQKETREVAARAYPHLGLNRLVVRPGYIGVQDEVAVSPRTVDARVPVGKELEVARELWQATILRAAHSALSPNENLPPIRDVMSRFADPEDAEAELGRIDALFKSRKETLLVTFDALDTLSRDWRRSTQLLDALLETIWSLRARRNIKAKLFIRPEQLNDDALRFVELPKLRSGRVELEWNQIDLYGLLFWQLTVTAIEAGHQESLASLASSANITIPNNVIGKETTWRLLSNAEEQKRLMQTFAGLFMGRGNKKGGTYDWPYNHLADAFGRVTPRSFIKLFVEAAKFGQAPTQQVISAEGIRHGLREASKVRVDQLGVEYPWIKRALAPLAGLVVPCEAEQLFSRWKESKTTKLIIRASEDQENGFLPPFPLPARGNEFDLLASAMQRIGVLAVREPERFDIPDLFRVAAQMLKKGGTPPTSRR